MGFSIGLGVLIFGYAGWTVVQHVRKSKKGKCAACSMSKSCTTSCDTEAR